jgi:hypothetical protein
LEELRLLEFKETKIDAERAGYIRYVATTETANASLLSKSEVFVVVRGKKMLIFMFSVGRLAGEREYEHLAQQFDAARPTFQRMAMSIVLKAKWPEPGN